MSSGDKVRTAGAVGAALAETSRTPLTWALAVATYNRADALLKCIEYSLSQTLPPAEIVVCDSSSDWESTAARARDLITRLAPTIRFAYVHSAVAQQTVQRNVALRQATADILFMIDDDSFLRDDAADRVMQIYEADAQRAIAAVGIGMMASWQPRAGVGDSSGEPARLSLGKKLARLILGSLFFAYPVRASRVSLGTIPQPVKSTTFMEGCQITVRREVAAAGGFDEWMISNRFEDADASYQFLGRGAVLILDAPLLFHAAAVNAVATNERRGVLSRFGWILNIAYLNRKFFGGDPYVRLFCWTHWLRMVPGDLAVAILRGDSSRLQGLLLAVGPLMRFTFAKQSQIGPVLARETEKIRKRVSGKGA